MEDQSIVLDNGTFECKIGYAGNDGPTCCV